MKGLWPRFPFLVLVLVLVLVLARASGGMAATEQDPIERLQGLLAERTGGEVDLERRSGEPSTLGEKLRSLLAQELTVARAVEIALLNNRNLQALFGELDGSRAELSQAGLLRNPELHAEVRFPGESVEFGLTQDLSDLLFRPQRKRVFSASLRQTELRVAHDLLELISEVKSAFYSLQAAELDRAMRATSAEASRASAELARRQHLAGNISALSLENSLALHEDARLDLAASELELLEARERLNLRLGTWGWQTDWRVTAELPELPTVEPSPEGLEALAVGNRLDLLASEAELRRAREALTLTRHAHWPTLELGIHVEREPEGTDSTGPAIELSFPLFDRGQAAAAGARAQIEQAVGRHAALAVEIRAQVRLAHARLSATRERVLYYREVVLPRRERIVAETQREYNFMLSGVHQLIQARRDAIHARRAHLEAHRDYWLARTELERAVGTSLPAGGIGERQAVSPGPPGAAP